MLDFFKNLSPTELIIIVVLIVVFFGAKKVTQLGKAGGETVREVKKIKNELIGDSKDEEEVKND